jgi:hypothetical protein
MGRDFAAFSAAFGFGKFLRKRWSVLLQELRVYER